MVERVSRICQGIGDINFSVNRMEVYLGAGAGVENYSRPAGDRCDPSSSCCRILQLFNFELELLRTESDEMQASVSIATRDL